MSLSTFEAAFEAMAAFHVKHPGQLGYAHVALETKFYSDTFRGPGEGTVFVETVPVAPFTHPRRRVWRGITGA